MSDAIRRLSILGATGSVGESALDLVRRAPGKWSVGVLAAGRNVARLAALAREFRPDVVAIADPTRQRALRDALSDVRTRVLAGADGVIEAAACPAHWTLSAIVGVAGLRPTLAAVRRGGVVAVANKESLVCAGPLMMRAARRSAATILPVDSEHNAIFQILSGQRRDAIRRVTLTASGGPFRDATADEMARATPAQALRHPTWAMGPKISVDSATMMNKTLELMEARALFDVPPRRIGVVMHPQSVVHALVDCADGSVLAHMGAADMRIPLAHTLAWPDRMDWGAPALDLATLGRLDFAPPDEDRFPALRVGRAVMAAGGAAPIVMNAANEVAVQAFLDGRIAFPRIVGVVEDALDRLVGVSVPMESNQSPGSRGGNGEAPSRRDEKSIAVENVLALDRMTRVWTAGRLRASARSIPVPSKSVPAAAAREVK